MSADDEDFRLLSLANHKRKFALSVLVDDPALQPALERGIDSRWFDLVDVSFIAATKEPTLMRIFRLTDAGLARLAELAQHRRRA